MSIHSISSALLPQTLQDPGSARAAAQPSARNVFASGAVETVDARSPAGSPNVPQAEPASPAEIRRALDEVREAVAPVAQNLLFSIDDDTGKTVIKIIDSSTDEVIKQIPSEEILAIARAIDKLQGLLIRQEA